MISQAALTTVFNVNFSINVLAGPESVVNDSANFTEVGAGAPGGDDVARCVLGCLVALRRS